MKMKYFLIFFLCILALAASEYLFLSELGNQQRLFILLFAVLIGIGSIITIFLCYKRLRKDV
jgi:hypothetical protein